MPKLTGLALTVQKLFGVKVVTSLNSHVGLSRFFAIFVIFASSVYLDVQYLSDLKGYSDVLWQAERWCHLVTRHINEILLALTGQKLLRFEAVTPLGCHVRTQPFFALFLVLSSKCRFRRQISRRVEGRQQRSLPHRNTICPCQ